MQGFHRPLLGLLLLSSITFPTLSFADALGPGLGFAIGFNTPENFEGGGTTDSGAQARGRSSLGADVHQAIILPPSVTNNPQCESGGQPCAGPMQEIVDQQMRDKGLKRD